MSNIFKSDEINFFAPDSKRIAESQKAANLVLELFSVNEVPISTAMLALMDVLMTMMQHLEWGGGEFDAFIEDVKSNLMARRERHIQISPEE